MVSQSYVFFWFEGIVSSKKGPWSDIRHGPCPGAGLRIPIAFPGWSFNAVSKSWTFMAMSQAHGGAGTWSSFDRLFPCVKWLSHGWVRLSLWNQHSETISFWVPLEVLGLVTSWSIRFTSFFHHIGQRRHVDEDMSGIISLKALLGRWV